MEYTQIVLIAVIASATVQTAYIYYKLKIQK